LGLNKKKERLDMRRLLCILALVFGMGILVAQEPVPQKNGPKQQDVPMKDGKGVPPRGKGGERRGPLSWKKLVDSMDKNKDSFLSKDELNVKSNMWDRWQKGDVDMDGKLSEKEFDDYQKKLMDRFKGGKGREDRKKD
jgi:hypothetical protein